MYLDHRENGYGGSDPRRWLLEENNVRCVQCHYWSWKLKVHSFIYLEMFQIIIGVIQLS